MKSIKAECVCILTLKKLLKGNNYEQIKKKGIIILQIFAGPRLKKNQWQLWVLLLSDPTVRPVKPKKNFKK